MIGHIYIEDGIVRFTAFLVDFEKYEYFWVCGCCGTKTDMHRIEKRIKGIYQKIRKKDITNFPTWETFTTNTSAYAFSVDESGKEREGEQIQQTQTEKAGQILTLRRCQPPKHRSDR